MGGPCAVGHSCNKSQTFLPVVADCEGCVVVDWPGIFDSGGFEIRIAVDVAVAEFMQYAKAAYHTKMFALLSVSDFSRTEGRQEPARQQIQKLRRLIPFSQCMIGITKCDEHLLP